MLNIARCPDCDGFISSSAHMARCYAVPLPALLCPCGCGAPHSETMNRPGGHNPKSLEVCDGCGVYADIAVPGCPQHRTPVPPVPTTKDTRVCGKNRYGSEQNAANALNKHAEAKGFNPWAMKVVYHEPCERWHIVPRSEAHRYETPNREEV